MRTGLGPRLGDIQAVTIGAFDPARLAQIQKHARMTQGPAIAVTGNTVGISLNHFRRFCRHGLGFNKGNAT
jgi:hypothetical protein